MSKLKHLLSICQNKIDEYCLQTSLPPDYLLHKGQFYKDSNHQYRFTSTLANRAILNSSLNC